MAVSFAVGVRACCVAVSLLLASARGAEPVSPLVGQTRDQLLARYGEPRSQIERGNRVIYFYARERVVLRDNVVVEVEEITAESITLGPPSSAVPDSAKDAARSGRPSAPSSQTASGSDQKVEIKLVRPPSAKEGRSSETGSAQIPVARPLPTPVVATPVPEVTSTPALPPAVSTGTPEVEAPPQAHSGSTNPADAREVSNAKKTADALEAKKKKDEALKAARRRQQEAAAAADAPTSSAFSTQVYVVAFLVVAGGAGLLYWRYRQRQLDLAASSVENTPLTSTAAAPVFTGSGFTAEVLNTLEWKRFEELVTAYYSKTGVVAVRTRTGPDSPVHIKISWKGEPRPFAYVQCIPHPTGLIDPKPLQALVAALVADDIRRGYVVTSGKFNVPARDFAEEKHLTLLPGDIFIEKLNALPATARTEIMQSISSADVS